MDEGLEPIDGVADAPSENPREAIAPTDSQALRALAGGFKAVAEKHPLLANKSFAKQVALQAEELARQQKQYTLAAKYADPTSAFLRGSTLARSAGQTNERLAKQIANAASLITAPGSGRGLSHPPQLSDRHEHRTASATESLRDVSIQHFRDQSDNNEIVQDNLVAQTRALSEMAGEQARAKGREWLIVWISVLSLVVSVAAIYYAATANQPATAEEIRAAFNQQRDGERGLAPSRSRAE